MPFDTQQISDRLQLARFTSKRASPFSFDSEEYGGFFDSSSVSDVVSILRPRVAPDMIAEIGISRKTEGDWLDKFEIRYGLSYLSPDQPEYSLAHDSLAKAKEAELSHFNATLDLIGIPQGVDSTPNSITKCLNADHVLFSKAREITREIFRRPPTSPEDLEAEIVSPLEAMRKALATIEKYQAGLLSPQEIADMNSYRPPPLMLLNLGTQLIGYYLSGRCFAIALFLNNALYQLTFTDLGLIARNRRPKREISHHPTMTEAFALLHLAPL